jgi:hypothetical protein
VTDGGLDFVCAVTVFVFLTGTAGARIIAADAWTVVLDGHGLLLLALSL